MIWVVISFASIFMAYISWYARGEGIISIIISGAVIGVVILYRKPKEFAIELGLSVVIAFIYQLVIPHWG